MIEKKNLNVKQNRHQNKAPELMSSLDLIGWFKAPGFTLESSDT